jgi:hypothetical protein
MNSKTFYHEKYILKFFTTVHRNAVRRKFIQYPGDLLAHPKVINLLLELGILQFEVLFVLIMKVA